MSQFATASISPCAIAWLIKTDDWDHLERVVYHNCILLGGYFNVLIPVSEDGALWSGYDLFLTLYDPDYIILAPGMTEFQWQNTAVFPRNPYAVIGWNDVAQILPTEPKSGSSTRAAPIGLFGQRRKARDDPQSFDLVATAEEKFPDASQLAFLACGDVSPTELGFEQFDGAIEFFAHGYREEILRRSAKEGLQADLSIKVGPDGEIIPAPNRFQLASIIRDENKFPLTGAKEIVEACCELQGYGNQRPSFVGWTAPYLRGSAIRKLSQFYSTPGMAVVVSDCFEFQEAVLFWNLRAAQVVVSWVSFLEFERDLHELQEWLDSDLGAHFYTDGQPIAFCTSEVNKGRLDESVSRLSATRQVDWPIWRTCSYKDLQVYDYQRHCIQKTHLSVGRDGNACSFLPDYPQDSFGSLSLTLEWPSLMLPRERAIADLVSPEKDFMWNASSPNASALIPRFRIAGTRHPRLRIHDQSPVYFVVPSIDDVLTKLFDEAGCSQFQRDDKAQYQKAFIDRSGSLDIAGYLLQAAPYAEFFSLISNKGNPNLPGWLLTRPEKRRALNQLDLWLALKGTSPPQETSRYFKEYSEYMPEEGGRLLKLGLMERGFQLSCSYCSSRSWYRLDEVGQYFRCYRCYEEQEVLSNPLWLYKLPEVIFQGFDTHMEVPLLSLYYLRRKSAHDFRYALDSKLRWGRLGKTRNVDFSCLSDGRVYIGEAKSGDDIEPEQFEFYEDLASRARVDGIVFATSTSCWKPSTSDRIEDLKSRFKGDVVVLTRSELFQQ